MFFKYRLKRKIKKIFKVQKAIFLDFALIQSLAEYQLKQINIDKKLIENILNNLIKSNYIIYQYEKSFSSNIPREKQYKFNKEKIRSKIWTLNFWVEEIFKSLVGRLITLLFIAIGSLSIWQYSCNKEIKKQKQTLQQSKQKDQSIRKSKNY